MELIQQRLTTFLMNMLSEDNLQRVNNDGRFGRRRKIYYITTEEAQEIEQEIISKCMQVITIIYRRNYVNQTLHGERSLPFMVYGIKVRSINKELAYKAFHNILNENGLERPNND